ncbi:hypothetical protein VF14_27085 [Nostoc linckia z18]|uniref:Uncharacterized protein n=2 Tax=Nostoc linckia TaxID=92942 RepID=A0A9Q5Z697_NOSLI|nr:hypothetical protein [Nostoc linckia]PHK29739.1 hypothetical protein VF12_30630 [Nostoc linckia z15]PHK42195.1 hypothetical protein VF13_30055 [Nostoc linckia z16]PHJ59449.1 hypothetical protein VF02_24895 [Nostoc linckia z1]PHJ62650.1 hypothetical protein VF05_26105 [Nostoc linckia z3]PHJ68802.1 hypothetical protein VF03_24375 [Nostoc linckia z2]
MDWVKVYDKAFNLHTNPRPRIVIIRSFQSRILSIQTSKFGSWDYSFIGWIVPILNAPSGVSEGRYTRLYLGNQSHILQPHDLVGNLEIKPRLWIPDLTVRIWELQGYSTPEQVALTNFERIESKIDGLINES